MKFTSNCLFLEVGKLIPAMKIEGFNISFMRSPKTFPDNSGYFPENGYSQFSGNRFWFCNVISSKSVEEA